MYKSILSLVFFAVFFTSNGQMNPFDLVPRFFDGLEKGDSEEIRWFLPSSDWMKDNLPDYKDNPDINIDQVEDSRDQWKAMLQGKYQQLIDNYK